MREKALRDAQGRKLHCQRPGPLDRAARELRQVEEGNPRGLWHLTRALTILVEYLVTKEQAS